MNGVIQRHTLRLTKYIRFPFSTIEQPKWTRFFVQSQPIQVNIERSLKNDASEQLNSYIRNNFKNFSDKQLIMGILKKDLNYDSHRLMHYELTDRIGQNNKRFLDLDTIQYLFSQEIFGYTWTTPIISQYFIIEGAKHYDQLNIKQQTQYISFALRNHYLNEQFSLNFLKNLKIDDDYFESLGLQTYKELFKFFDQFNVSVYELGLQEGFLETLFNKYIQLISNYDLNNAGRTDYLHHLIRVFPQYFTQQMRQQIKIAYAAIMEKSLNKDYLYILPKQIEVRELSRLIYNLYDISDFPLIKNCLIMMLDQYSDLQKQDMQYYSIIKKFQYFNPQFFFLVLQSVKSFTEQQNSIKNDIFQNYENKIEQVILFKFVEGFKQFKLQDYEIIKMSQSVQQIFQYYFNDLQESALTHGVEELVSNDIEQPPESIYQPTVYQEFAQLYQANQLKIQTEEKKLDYKQDFCAQFQMNCKQSIEAQSAQLTQLGFIYTLIRKNDPKLLPLMKICGFIELLSGALIYDEIQQINFSEIKLFKSTLFLNYFQKLCFIPGLFDNVLKIYKLAPELFSQEATQKIESLKREVDQIYNQAKDPQNFIEQIEQELEQYDLSKYRPDKYIKWSLIRLFSTMNLNTSNNTSQLKYMKDQGHENNFNETYKISRRNMLFYAINNCTYIIQFTPLKQILNEALKLDIEEWIMNYSDQPFILDFVCKKQKIVIFLDEYPRIIKGVQKMRNLDTTLAEKYYKNQDYQVVYLDYSIYHPNPKELLQILREKLVYRFCDQ